jgi:4-hydroxy-tetrahydrodipicolinate synthase
MFTGVGTALITPFDENRNVDYPALKKLVKYQVDNNVDAIIVIGTTAEAPVISLDEREKIIDTVIEETKGRTKIIMGTGSDDTNKVVQLNKIAEKYKVDGLLIVNPYYNKGTQESIVVHFKYIEERTTLPIILYNVPSRTGMNMLPETVVKIIEQCPNVIGIKEACGNISQISQLFSMVPDSFNVFSGNDDQTFPIMALGGAGIISVFSNAFPKQLKMLTDSILKGDYKKARELNNKYMNMMNLLFVEASPSPVKFVLSEMGYCKNVVRLPLIPVLEKSQKLLREELKNYNS